MMMSVKPRSAEHGELFGHTVRVTVGDGGPIQAAVARPHQLVTDLLGLRRGLGDEDVLADRQANRLASVPDARVPVPGQGRGGRLGREIRVSVPAVPQAGGPIDGGGRGPADPPLGPVWGQGCDAGARDAPGGAVDGLSPEQGLDSTDALLEQASAVTEAAPMAWNCSGPPPSPA